MSGRRYERVGPSIAGELVVYVALGVTPPASPTIATIGLLDGKTSEAAIAQMRYSSAEPIQPLAAAIFV